MHARLMCVYILINWLTATYSLIADVASDDNDSQTFLSDKRVGTIAAAERPAVTRTFAESTVRVTNTDSF